jgi:primosomal protein N' (replication factor Y)
MVTANSRPLPHPTSPAPNSAVVSVLLPTMLDYPLSYCAPSDLEPYSWVEVGLRKKTVVGLVWPKPADQVIPEIAKLKPILRQLNLPSFPAIHARFLREGALRTLAPAGMMLRLALLPPKDLLRAESLTAVAQADMEEVEPHADLPASPFPLTPMQQQALQDIRGSWGGASSLALLEGVTGSGKTAVYFELVAEALGRGQQVLVLLPEIALTAPWLDRFEARFGFAPQVWHSGQTPARRRDIWLRALRGVPMVVVGARSALFLPFSQLGLVVMDEEHDGSYKQEEGVIYHTRPLAALRAKLEACPLLLVTATPSVETHAYVQRGQIAHATLTERLGEASLPTVSLVDLREHPIVAKDGLLSPPLITALQENLAAGEQSLLFLNRRGYAPLLRCCGCQHRWSCPQCSTYLVEHRAAGRWVCHLCGYHEPEPQDCPECQGVDIARHGLGVEKVAEQVAELLPGARVRIATSDTVTTMAEADGLVKAMLRGDIDVLVGTQLVAKGYHFPQLTLIGVLDADMSLHGSDFRASERSFQLLSQVAGRAGREQQVGRVLIQTMEPAHPLLQSLARWDQPGFYAEELAMRQRASLPPFGRLAAFIISDPMAVRAEQTAKQLLRGFDQLAKDPVAIGVRVLGPVPAPIYRLRGRYRYRLLVKGGGDRPLQPLLRQLRAAVDWPSSTMVKIDLDPYSFY